jgi:hypothetical protein
MESARSSIARHTREQPARSFTDDGFQRACRRYEIWTLRGGEERRRWAVMKQLACVIVRSCFYHAPCEHRRATTMRPFL